MALLREMAGTQLNAELVQYFLSVTPVFPPGMEVTLHGGDYEGFRALVVRTPETAPDRPVARVFRDAAGKAVDPFDIALEDEPELSVSE